MLSVAISCSDDVDAQCAVDLVVSDCKRQLAGARPKAGIMFTSLMDADFSEMLKQINVAFPEIELIGCTTDGEIVSGQGFIQDSVSLLLFAGEDIDFASSAALQASKDSGASIISAIEDCEKQLEGIPALCIVLPDGLSTIGTPLDRAIQSATGNRYPVFGGTAGDHFRLTRTYQFHGEQVHSDACPILMIGGNLKIESAIRYGVRAIGKRYAITSFENNIVHTIDNEPAVDFYDQRLGNLTEAVELSQFPLAIYVGDRDGYYLRDPLSLDRETGAVTFVGNFEGNSWARQTVFSREEMLRSADEANTHVLNSSGAAGPDLVLLFSCTSRKHILGSKADAECAQLKNDSREIPFFGFYCYGEIGPFSGEGPTFFHSDTYIAVGISSR